MPEAGKPKGDLARYGEKLVDQGFQIIPIRRGSKAPPFDDWQKVRATKKQVRDWTSENGPYTRAGVGILTRLAPAVDIDILDQAVALQMEAFVLENFGFAPIRVGFAPKRLLVFRTDEPFDKVNSKTFIDPFGDPDISHTESGKPNGDWRKVEILGDGQQFVAFHIHKDTGKPYEWLGPSPLTVRHDDLPYLDRDGAEQIVAEFDRLALKAGWTVKAGAATSLKRLERSGVRRIAHDDVFAADKAKTDISDDELHRKLLLVPGAEDYETWVQVGMALYHQYSGEELGRELWHEWSQTADNYDNDALDAKWDSFDVTDKGREPVTARLIIKLADANAREVAVETFREIKEELAGTTSVEELKTVCDKIKHILFDVLQRQQIIGIVKDRFKALTTHLLSMTVARQMVAYENPAPKDLPRWLEGWVYTVDDKGFYSTTKRTFMSTEAFNASFCRNMLTPKEVLEGKAIPETPATAYALNSKQIPIVQRRMYMPGEDDLFHYNSVAHVNSYNAINIPDTPGKMNAAEREAVEIAKNHFSHLFTNEKDRRALLDSIAFIVQNPSRRLQYACLLQGVEKDGKTWFAGLLAAVLGPENVRNLAAQALEEKFNGWAEATQVVFFEEIKLHGHNRFDVVNKVKPLITNRMISVRRMQTDAYEVVNTATYFLTTNFRDALPLDSNDSRYLILFSRFQDKETLKAFKQANPLYYKRLYGALEHGGALRKWLLQHKLSPDFDPDERAPDSEAQREMVDLAKTEEIRAFEEVMSESTTSGLDEYVLSVTLLAEAMAATGVDVPYGAAMARMLVNKGYTRIGKIRFGDDTPTIWSKHPRKFKSPDGQVATTKIKNWLLSDL